MKMFPLLN